MPPRRLRKEDNDDAEVSYYERGGGVITEWPEVHQTRSGVRPCQRSNKGQRRDLERWVWPGSGVHPSRFGRTVSRNPPST